MKRKNVHSFIKSHNLVNRIYDMLDYFDFFDNNNEYIVKAEIKTKIQNIYYIETMAKFFEEKKLKSNGNIELKCNLNDLINDLNYLKQYLV